MQVIGLTGGVGAGKSVILEILQREYGCYVISADEVGHRMMQKGGITYRSILAEYGSDILDAEGEIDKGKLAAIGFADNASAERLSACTHPLIRQEIREEIARAVQTHPLLVLESAIPVQGKLVEICDVMWYVYVPWEIRKQRIMESRGYSAERAEQTMKRQPADGEYRAICDAVIDNSGSLEDTRSQLERLVSQIREQMEHVV
ncbi:MAG: dephospho-CoA kinase [Lachnospiraceae bacterium]|nr:dephospho-CoA kinase [Lachnospiraceae bacterium]